MHSFLLWLQATSLATVIAEATWLFPIIETLHVIGLALAVGSILSFDLRVLGLGWKARALATLNRDILPWTWAGFLLALTTGLLMFASAAERYAANPLFLVKIGLLLLAGLNAAIFHLHPHHRRFATEQHLSPILKASATASLTLWVGTIVLGRWIGFV